MKRQTIHVLEHFDFTEEQLKRLNSLGNLKYFEKATEQQIHESAKVADVILIDWINPNTILPIMKKGALLSLPYTGVNWITELKPAIERGVLVSNENGASANSVAEIHLGFMLDIAHRISYFNNFMKDEKEPPFKRAIDLVGSTVGIIGLGTIGKRLAELLKGFNCKIINYSKTKKTVDNIENVDLKTLLKTSDYICICCTHNDETENLINLNNVNLIKNEAIITATTANIVQFEAIQKMLKENKLYGFAIDGLSQSKEKIPQELINDERVISTYHRAYDTKKSYQNMIDYATDNIEAYIKGKPINLVKP